jgi:hypothetical protein
MFTESEDLDKLQREQKSTDAAAPPAPSAQSAAALER